MTISIIGLGAAGGNIADEFAKEGFLTGAINFSQKDLESLEHVGYTLRLPGSDGMGHNREKAIPFISKHHKMIINFIQQNFSNETVDVMIFPFSTGGGSGSGMAPLIIEMMSNILPEKTIIAMPILPSYNEATISQINTLEVFNTLQSLDVCVLPVDNQQLNNGKLSNHELYKKVNQSVVESFLNLLKYTNSFSKHGNFDTRDFITVFQTKGFATISTIDLALIKSLEVDLSSESFTNQIQESWNKTVFTPIEKESIMKSAFIYDGQESLLDYINKNQILSVFTNEPLDLFEGIYNTGTNKGKITMVMTGLNPCKTRLSQIDEIINSKSSTFEKLTQNEDVQFKPKTTTNSFMVKLSQPKKQTKNISDILSKYKR